MSDMVCANCGSYEIYWRGDLLNNPWTECQYCGGRNCQEPEPIEDEEEGHDE